MEFKKSVLDIAGKEVSFETGKNLSPLGIFPFEQSNIYIVFDGLGHFADGNTKMNYAQKHNLKNVSIPTVEFFEQLFAIKELLNKSLKALNKNELRG